MSIFTQQMERKIIVLERNDTETKERNAEMNAAELLLSV